MTNLFNQINRNFLDKAAIIGEDKSFTYAEFLGAISAVSNQLVQQSIGRGDRVGLQGLHSYQILVAYYACMKIGATPVPIPFVDEERVQGAYLSAEIKHVLSGDDLAINPIGSTVNETEESTVNQDEAIVIFTSGTTSNKLKGVRLSHRGISSICHFMNDAMEVDSCIIECVYASLDHAYGYGRCHSVLAAGGTLVLPKSINRLATLFGLLRREKCNALSIAPSIISSILQTASQHLSVFKDQIKWIQTGAMKFDKYFRENLSKTLPNTRLFLHYGLSEAMRVTFFELNRYPHKGHTEGRPSRGVELQIWDEENNQVAHGDIGVIAIRGDNLCLGYLDDDLWQSNCVNGWFKTSDRGYLDEDGFLIYAGRNDDVINMNGTLIHPDEIESKLVSLIAKNAFSVVGVKDPKKLKDSIAVVCIEGDSGVSMRDIAEHMQKSDAIMLPSHLVQLDALPRTRTGKVNRKALQDKIIDDNLIA